MTIDDPWEKLFWLKFWNLHASRLLEMLIDIWNKLILTKYILYFHSISLAPKIQWLQSEWMFL